MLNKLEWLHGLNIQYDCSTFDTDPFEPQPEGRHTIFPFSVSAPEAVGGNGDGKTAHRAKSEQPGTVNGNHPRAPRRGYVELPYTLPQDSTLFLLLGETTPDIWLRKLEWIATHGGMALL